MKTICKHLLYGIQFCSDKIIPCGSKNWDNCECIDKYFFKVENSNLEFDFQKYFEKRAEYINLYKEGKEPEFCKNCSLYEGIAEYDNADSATAFKEVEINHRMNCHCKCVYCCIAGGGKLEEFEKNNKFEAYDIKPILAQIENMKLINKNTRVRIFGGECTEYPEELKYIIDWGLRNDCSFRIDSNCIIYNEDIANLLRNHKIELCTSFDAGTRKTFEKIKRVKAFDRVVENIKKYREALGDNSDSIIHVKYLLCPGKNGNVFLNEIKSFVALMAKVDVTFVSLSINKYWLSVNAENPIDSDLYKTIKYFCTTTDYPKLPKKIDPNEIWDWWLDKVLNDKQSLLDKLKLLFNK